MHSTMKTEQLDAILTRADAKLGDDGWSEVAEGRQITFYAASDGVGLTVGKVEAVKRDDGLLLLRTARGETYALDLERVFAGAIDSGKDSDAGRRAGFR